jgi:hypothetical protein
MLLLKEPISRKKEKKGTKNVNIFKLFSIWAAQQHRRKRKDEETCSWELRARGVCWMEKRVDEKCILKGSFVRW